MRTLNLPMETENYEALFSKKQTLKASLGREKDLTWRDFFFLMKEIPDRTLVKAARRLHLDSEE